MDTWAEVPGAIVTVDEGTTYAGTTWVCTSPTASGVLNTTAITWRRVAKEASGLWTPTITFATPGDLAVSYAAQVGNRYKVGRLVNLNFSLTFTPTYLTASGGILIGGFPDALNDLFAAGQIRLLDITRPEAFVLLYPTSTSAFSLRTISTSGTVTQLGTSQFATGVAKSIQGAITYVADH
jgi:hypothetical protein